MRELENLIERLRRAARRAARSTSSDLPAVGARRDAPPLRARGAALPGERRSTSTTLVDRFETDLIREALEQTHWNKKQAAQLLGLNRTTLLEKIKKIGPARPSALSRSCAPAGAKRPLPGALTVS